MANGDSSREAPKEAASLKKKQTRFAKRLIDGPHGEAWRACQSLVESSEELRVVDAYEKVFAALQSIHNVGVIKANEAFDIYFKNTYRKIGQTMDSYSLQRRRLGRSFRTWPTRWR